MRDLLPLWRLQEHWAECYQPKQMDECGETVKKRGNDRAQ